MSAPGKSAKPKRPGWFARRRAPTAEVLYDTLRRDAQLRLKLVDGKPYAAVLDKGAVLLLPVPSKDWFEFLDSFQIGRNERLAKQSTLFALTSLVGKITGAPGFGDELPLGSGGHDWGTRRSLLERELGDPLLGSPPAAGQGPGSSSGPASHATQSLDLSDLKLKTKPEYLERNFWGLSDLEIMRRAYRSGQAVLLFGMPGSGKTTAANAFAFSEGLPICRFACHDGFESSDAIGTWARVNGDWRWVEGRLTALALRGGLALFDELDSARPEVLARLHPLFEEPRQLSLPEHLGETITACPAFGLLATANPPGRGGGKELAPRMVDRFAVRLPYEYDEQIERRLCNEAQVLAVFKALRNDPGVRSPVSTRLLCQFVENIRVYGQEVAANLLVNGFEEDERARVAAAFESYVVSSRDRMARASRIPRGR